MSRRDHGREKEHWGSSVGVVLAVAGGAIGLGNFLRFPGQVATYGGGAFMIPYFISMLIVAIPLAWSEWALGRAGGRRGYHSQPAIYRAAGNDKTIWGVCGGICSLAPLVICMYYVFIESWCLLYALQYLGGLLRPLGLGFSLFPTLDAGLKLGDSAGYEAFFAQFVGMSGGDGSLFRDVFSSPLLLATAACALTNFTLIYFGIAKGIERFCKIATPLLALCSVLVILRVATLGNPTGVEGQVSSTGSASCGTRRARFSTKAARSSDKRAFGRRFATRKFGWRRRRKSSSRFRYVFARSPLTRAM